jgi:hypothetical protein
MPPDSYLSSTLSTPKFCQLYTSAKMERLNFVRQDTNTVNPVKRPHITPNELDLHDSKESQREEKTSDHVPKLEIPPYRDAGSYIGKGEMKALETAEDIVTTVIHLDDDPHMNPWTFRMFFIGKLPYLCFGRCSAFVCCLSLSFLS